MATVTGLTPHTSHLLVAIFDSLPSLNVLQKATFIIRGLPSVTCLGCP
jgi:hypothetical protein